MRSAVNSIKEISFERQGDLDDDLYLICSGELALEISVPHHGQVQIEIIAAGEVLGSSSLAPTIVGNLMRAITAILAYQIEGKRLLSSWKAITSLDTNC